MSCSFKNYNSYQQAHRGREGMQKGSAGDINPPGDSLPHHFFPSQLVTLLVILLMCALDIGQANPPMLLQKEAGQRREGEGRSLACWHRHNTKWRVSLGNFVIENADIYYLTLLFKNSFKEILILCV